MPKCPVRSGCRVTRGTLPTVASPGVEPGRGRARLTDEAIDLCRILPARRRLDAGVHVDTPGPRHADRLAHRLGREAARENDAPPGRRLSSKRPRDRRPRLALAPAGRAVQEERGGLVAIELGELPRVPNLDGLEHRDWRGGDDLRRLDPVELD